MRLARVPLVLVVALTGLALLACGGGDSNDSSTPTPTRGDDNDSEATPSSETIVVSARDNAFDTDRIVVEAGAEVTIQFTNEEVAPHNISVYESRSAEAEIFVGNTVSGPDKTITYEFIAPEEPGVYFFRCDVHPVAQVGDFVVR